MKKIYSLLLLGGLLFFGVQSASAWYLRGSWYNDWKSINMGGSSSCSVYLDASTTYSFEINSWENPAYGATKWSESYTYTATGSKQFTKKDDSSTNCQVTTTYAGLYTFEITGWESTDYRPTIKITYPTSNGNASFTASFVNSINWSRIYAYVYNDEGDQLGPWPGKQLSSSASKDTEYSLSFTANSVPEVIIWHDGSGTQTANSPFGNCEYECTEANNEAQINEYTVKPNANGWATFCARNRNVTIPAGITVYTATYNEGIMTLHPTSNPSGFVLEHSKGVILKKENSSSFTISATTDDADDLEGDATNWLRGIHWASAPGTGKTAYIMATQAGVTGFYQYNGTKIPAFKAALELVTSGDAPSVIRFVDEENNTTSIEAIEANDKAVKFFENGQLRILREGVVYDATGRVVR